MWGIGGGKSPYSLPILHTFAGKSLLVVKTVSCTNLIYG